MSESDSSKDSVKELLENIVQPVKDQIDYRLKTPLVGGFILSWLAFNWEKIAVLALSKENIYTRLDKIANLPQVSLPLIGDHFTNTFIFPLLSTVFLTLVVPFINREVIKRMHSLNLENIDTNVELAYRSQITSSEQRKIEENNNLAANRAQFESTTLKEEYSKIGKNITTLKIEKEKLENSIEELNIYFSDLEVKTTEFESRYGSYKEAENKIQSLAIANRDMTTSVREVQELNNGLLEEAAANSSEINRLTSLIDNHQKLNVELLDKNSHLTTENEQLRQSEAFAKEQLTVVEESRFNEFSDTAEVISYAEDSLKVYLDKLKSGTVYTTMPGEYRDLQDVLNFVTDKKNSLKKSYWPKNKPFPERTVKERMKH